MNILDVVKGRNLPHVKESMHGDFWTLCPFCGTGKMLIDARKNLWGCYDCKKHGHAGELDDMLRKMGF